MVVTLWKSKRHLSAWNKGTRHQSDVTFIVETVQCLGHGFSTSLFEKFKYWSGRLTMWDKIFQYSRVRRWRHLFDHSESNLMIMELVVGREVHMAESLVETSWKDYCALIWRMGATSDVRRSKEPRRFD